ncbi:bifunctional sugar-1-phosphate nucleotidylyltransferase/acetyltransferase [Halobacterium zhouii]|uniref:bifunctional sugar-1-phosphate nucleotidylyltransferase/acetyltransferase n=1 Tax=Halobacterium zhouii TaxID=2902624 RepID=UPI001E49E23B|nr:bifunctional sugar-1-phosphate nucleotidylyltransferase/acetyltransferase [Halobacterium zhouii]
MQAVLLAAGRGTRMRPLTDGTPKPLLPVADRPLAAHGADAAVEAGVDELVVVVGYEGDAVREAFGETYRGVPVTYAVQNEQRGTADAVRAAREYLDGEFVVLNGDNLYDPDDVAALFDAGPAVGAFHAAEPSNYGVLSTDGERVTGIVEKPADPPSNLANAGAYAFPAAALDWLDVPESERGEHELTDVLARTVEHTHVRPVTFDRWLDVGRPWELLEANEWKLAELSSRVDGDVSEDATLSGRVVVEEGATVAAGATIEGPVLLCEGASVGSEATVRGASLVGPGCSVGPFAEVVNSVLMADVSVDHPAYVGDSVIGRRVVLGAGTKVHNFNHDGEEVITTVKNRRVSTDRERFGAVIGDGARTGENTTLAPGTTLASGETTDPGETVSEES